MGLGREVRRDDFLKGMSVSADVSSVKLADDATTAADFGREARRGNFLEGTSLSVDGTYVGLEGATFSAADFGREARRGDFLEEILLSVDGVLAAFSLTCFVGLETCGGGFTDGALREEGAAAD